MEKIWGIGPLQIVTEQQILENQYVVIEGKKICQICDAKQLPADCEIVHAEPNFKLMPGMIDQHIHGIAGADAMDGTGESLQTISTSLAKYGVTSFLATTMTADVELVKSVVQTIAQNKEQVNGAKIIGIHLEGPFINPIQKGAQSDQFIIKPSVELFTQIEQAAQQTIKLVTIAAELDEDHSLCNYFKSKQIVGSIGHSDATFEQTQTVLNKQLIQNATHFSNGMRAIHHREPGLQIALLQSDSMIEIIADGYHIHPKMIRFLFDTVGEERMILISDSMRAADLSDGIYDLGGQQVQVENGLCKLVGKENIAGSTLNLNLARKNMKQWLKLSDVTLAKLTATNSAKLLGLANDKGSIAVGKDADLYVLNEQEEVVLTVCEGKIVYQNTKLKKRLLNEFH
ncbi:N-acetylglucosamine-6-phosphate deacetylase [Solibacillus daqui]|uniref:N-acetylglucosamine-6-phosphate deacetylase n=1 Tax=Solibacillus daqui TaxID=2912187 RepID=UPI002365AACE|nr:N-acetylglucosamine-6-phosphate deacetylase [Solibacillus daqui]